MAEWSKALRSGRSLVLQAWVRIPLLTSSFLKLIIHYTHSILFVVDSVEFVPAIWRCALLFNRIRGWFSSRRAISSFAFLVLFCVYECYLDNYSIYLYF